MFARDGFEDFEEEERLSGLVNLMNKGGANDEDRIFSH